jgi:GNAT superfamily N-acetyltransferase
MSYIVSSVSEVEYKPALNDLLLEYYGVILRKFVAAGAPAVHTPDDLLAPFWPGLNKVLPPAGRLFLVHDEAARLVGCGTLQQVRPDAGEMKRIYIRFEARGRGLGRTIVNHNMNAARGLGWKTLLVNVIQGNAEILRIFEGIGFRYIDRYPECSDPIEADPYFLYMQYDFN